LTGPAVLIETSWLDDDVLTAEAAPFLGLLGIDGLRFGTGCRFEGPYLLTRQVKDPSSPSIDGPPHPASIPG
jgi:hypothetical protein